MSLYQGSKALCGINIVCVCCASNSSNFLDTSVLKTCELINFDELNTSLKINHNEVLIEGKLDVAETTTTDTLKVNESITSKTITNSGNLNVCGNTTLKDTTASNITANKIKTSSLEVGDDVTIQDGLIATNNEIHTPEILTCSIKPYSKNNTKLDIGHTNVSVNNLTVSGNLIQSGSAYNTHAEDLYVKNSCIKLRDCTNVGMSSSDKAGLTVLKYNGTDNMNLFVDCAGVARLGKETSLQPLALRDEEANMTDGKVVEWDSDSKSLKTAACSVSELDTKITKCYNNNASKITALCGGDIAYKNKANVFNCTQTIVGKSRVLEASNITDDTYVGIGASNKCTGCAVEIGVGVNCNIGLYDRAADKWFVSQKNNCVYIYDKPAVCVLSFNSSTGTLCLG